MKSIFQDFQSLSESDLIWMQNKYLDEVFKKFSFYLINKYNDDLIDFTINKITKLYQKTDYKNIFILEYIEEKQGFRFNSNFFFLCFENALIIIEISEIKRFYVFLSQCKESKIFILSENNEIINQIFGTFKLNSCMKDEFGILVKLMFGIDYRHTSMIYIWFPLTILIITII